MDANYYIPVHCIRKVLFLYTFPIYKESVNTYIAHSLFISLSNLLSFKYIFENFP